MHQPVMWDVTQHVAMPVHPMTVGLLVDSWLTFIVMVAVRCLTTSSNTGAADNESGIPKNGCS
jgi:hypothetical protein